jgi:hypothetical protein
MRASERRRRLLVVTLFVSIALLSGCAEEPDDGHPTLGVTFTVFQQY